MPTLPPLVPWDEHNRRLAAHVHPDDWVNPTPSGRYHLVVVGAGTAGLVTAAAAAGLGAKVALIERDLMGGDCLNVGCVPSKALIRAARVVAAVRHASDFGVRLDNDTSVDFERIMQRMRRLRADISPHDSVRRFHDLGVDVYLGSGRFVGGDAVEVAGQPLRFRRAVIATGARAAALPIPGLTEIAPMTNETVFSLTELPSRLTVIGGGPIGVEMAQSFARFGSQVTLLEMGPYVLSREDPDAAAIVQDALRRDGVQVHVNAETVRFERRDGDKLTCYRQDGEERQVASDHVLLGIGRAPNVDDLGLPEAGVAFDARQGIEVNDRLQTTNPRIFAAGDVASRFKFTHAADFMARIVVQNTLFPGRAKVSGLVIPWCTYTSPEVAHVGMTGQQAAAAGIPVDTFTQQLQGVDRAILDGETEGFARVHVKRGSDKIVGATIVAQHAGDLIAEFSLAMTHRLGLKKIGAAIHPYPTQAEAIRRLGDQYNRTRLTARTKWFLKRWFEWTR